MRYIKSFQNDAAIQVAVDNKTLGKPYVALNDQTGKIDFNTKSDTPDYSKMYLTIEALEDGDINIKGYPLYSVNDGEWVMCENSHQNIVTLKQGDLVRFKSQDGVGINMGMLSDNTIKFKAYGNIESIDICGDNFIGQTSVMKSTSAFTSCFANCTGLTDVSNLVLPAITLASYCYVNMFHGCTSITTPPALPATTLAQSCYQGMFFGCTSLTTAPELPATALTQDCYYDMFQGCVSLATAPVLPATTLADACYGYMFGNCTSLTTAPAELPATTLANNCYEGMFYSCTSLTTAPALPATTLAERCYAYMFDSCSGLTIAPELPSSILPKWAYKEMFDECKNISYVKCLATDISANYCVRDWLYGVSSTGTFVKKAGATWPTGTSGIPSGWTVIEE